MSPSPAYIPRRWISIWTNSGRCSAMLSMAKSQQPPSRPSLSCNDTCKIHVTCLGFLFFFFSIMNVLSHTVIGGRAPAYLSFTPLTYNFFRFCQTFHLDLAGGRSSQRDRRIELLNPCLSNILRKRPSIHVYTGYGAAG